MVIPLRGMISTFDSSDTSDPLIKYLMLPDGERASAPKPMVALRQKARGCDAEAGASFTFSAQPILDARVRDLLCDFLEFMWKETATDRDRVDMPRLAFLQLLDEREAEVNADGARVRPPQPNVPWLRSSGSSPKFPAHRKGTPITRSRCE